MKDTSEKGDGATMAPQAGITAAAPWEERPELRMGIEFLTEGKMYVDRVGAVQSYWKSNAEPGRWIK